MAMFRVVAVTFFAVVIFVGFVAGHYLAEAFGIDLWIGQGVGISLMISVIIVDTYITTARNVKREFDRLVWRINVHVNDKQIV